MLGAERWVSMQLSRHDVEILSGVWEEEACDAASLQKVRVVKMSSMSETYQSAAVWRTGLLGKDKAQRLAIQPGIRMALTKFYIVLDFLSSRSHGSLVFSWLRTYY